MGDSAVLFTEEHFHSIAETAPAPGARRRVTEVLLLAAAYYVSARLGLLLAFEHTNATPVWPPSGIAFAAVLLLGRRVWPGIALGAFLANTHVFLSHEVAGVGTVLAVSAAIAAGNTIEALVGSWMLPRWSGATTPIDAVRGVFQFLGAAFFMCLVAACMGPTAIALAGVAPWSLSPTVWFTGWIGDVTGILVLTPLLVTLCRPSIVRWTRRRRVELAIVSGALAATTFVAFGGGLPDVAGGRPLEFFTIPFLVYSAFRFGPRGTAFALLVVSGIAVTQTIREEGPFVQETVNLSLLYLQAFVIVLTVTGLVTAAIVREYREVVGALRKTQEELESRVEARTSDLSRTNTALRRQVEDRERAESALLRTRRDLQEYVDSMSTLNARVAPDGRMILVNRAAQVASGVPFPELMKMNFLEGPWWAFDPAVQARVRVAFTKAVNGTPVNYDERLRTAGNRVITINFSLVPVRGEDGRLSYILAEGRDITAQKQAEKRFRDLLESAPDAMVIVDRSGRIMLVNSRTERVFGYRREELVGQPVELLVPERLRLRHANHRGTYFSEPRPRPMGAGLDLFGRRRDGTEFPVEISLSPLETEEGLLVSSAIRDITQRKRAEEELQRNRLLLAQAQEIAHLGTWEWDMERDRVSWSEELYRLYGLEAGEFVPTYDGFLQRVHPEDRARVDAAVKKSFERHTPFEFDHRIVRPDGAVRWLHAQGAVVIDGNGRTVKIMGTGLDITDRKNAEEERDRATAQLLHGQKMQAIGQLAAGIAHEVKDPTGFILSNLNTLRDYFARLAHLLDAADRAFARVQAGEPAATVKEDLDRLRAEADAAYILDDFNLAVNDSIEGGRRIRDIVASLRAFSPADEGELARTDLNDCLESTLRLCWNELKYKATVERDFQDLPPAPCYPQRISQVFVNLLVNAVQAIPDKGAIRISTRRENGSAVVRIRDNGCGIPPEALPHVFEPFFTTKPVGKGTGLGLHIAYKIVEAHGGRIEVQSEVGQGTEVAVRLPLETAASKT